MLGSVLGSILTQLLIHAGRLNAEQSLNATLAGGVAMGCNADIIVTPFIPILIGMVAASISTIGFHYFPRIVFKYLRLHDSCGVIYLHLVPGLLGGLLSGLIAGVS